RGGRIDGDIHATELVELHAPAQVRGDIRTQALYMDKGVVFDGSCVMGEIRELEDQRLSPRSAEDTSPDGYKDQPIKT
ncbi:MAG: polymer-forming cytoskeletal protein, partial [Myxococcales bacterium]|nr:polymer-forming cytoskeletal protein [Myxococcales bacterium]